ncbi:hypothetical protein VTL71DRAFT_7538 [Oculimacula yallundae]|uniref:BZIP domain-containing protein n=1 Tax=Oculimacula yallundae TaxID=86028 RepID=A0ABR4BUE9_9HELO
MDYQYNSYSDESNKPQEGTVQLQRMVQQAEVRVIDDDWTGRTSASERRKLQNRLHQRKFRKQRKLRKAQDALGSESSSQVRSSPEESINAGVSNAGYHVARLQAAGTTSIIVLREQSRSRSSGEELAGNTVTANQVQEQIARFEDMASRELRNSSPRSDLLLTLIQFNVFRALVSNTSAMGFPFDWLSAEAESPFNTSHSTPIDLSQYPPNLQPTALQICIPHHPWIDLFPFPALRDTMLLQGEDFDEDDLCYDLVEICHAPSERSGLIVWADAWNPESWEMTEEFARKWGWMLRGCEDLMRSTNFWRRQRGEEDLIVETLGILSMTEIPEPKRFANCDGLVSATYTPGDFDSDVSLRRSVIGSLRSVSPFINSNNSDHSNSIPRTTPTLGDVESTAIQNGRSVLLKRSVTTSPTPESTLSRMSSIRQVSSRQEPFPKFADYERDIELVATMSSRTLDARDVVFERLLQIHPAIRETTHILFQLPANIRRRIYGFCFPYEERKVTLSPSFATKAVFPEEFFASPWDVLDAVTGGLQSSSMLRKELIVYFWTEYQFHVTLNEFSGPKFSPLSHVWLLQYTSIIQRITIEVDFTKFGCSQLEDAKKYGYKLSKTKQLLDSIIHLMCRRYSGYRDSNDNIVDSSKDRYCPNSVLSLCDSLIHLRGMLYQCRVSGFPEVYSNDLLDSLFRYENVAPTREVPEDNAWPFVPPVLMLPELPIPQQRIEEPPTPVSLVSMEYGQLILQQSRSLLEEMEDEMSWYSTSPKSFNYALSPRFDDHNIQAKVEETITSPQSSSYVWSPFSPDTVILTKEEKVNISPHSSSYALSPLFHDILIPSKEEDLSTSPQSSSDVLNSLFNGPANLSKEVIANTCTSSLSTRTRADETLFPEMAFPDIVVAESAAFEVPETPALPAPMIPECITPAAPVLAQPARSEAVALPRTPEPASSSTPESTTPAGSTSFQPGKIGAILLPRTPASKSRIPRALTAPSPSTPNKMNQLNEQDPAFIRTVNAMRSLDGAHTLRQTMIASPKTPIDAGSTGSGSKTPMTKRKYMSFVNRLRGWHDD